jgi:hypothetical protein
MSEWRHIEATDDECMIAHSLRKRFYAERKNDVGFEGKSK